MSHLTLCTSRAARLTAAALLLALTSACATPYARGGAWDARMTQTRSALDPIRAALDPVHEERQRALEGARFPDTRRAEVIAALQAGCEASNATWSTPDLDTPDVTRLRAHTPTAQGVACILGVLDQLTRAFEVERIDLRPDAQRPGLLALEVVLRDGHLFLASPKSTPLPTLELENLEMDAHARVEAIADHLKTHPLPELPPKPRDDAAATERWERLHHEHQRLGALAQTLTAPPDIVTRAASLAASPDRYLALHRAATLAATLAAHDAHIVAWTVTQEGSQARVTVPDEATQRALRAASPDGLTVTLDPKRGALARPEALPRWLDTKTAPPPAQLHAADAPGVLVRALLDTPAAHRGWVHPAQPHRVRGAGLGTPSDITRAFERAAPWLKTASFPVPRDPSAPVDYATVYTPAVSVLEFLGQATSQSVLAPGTLPHISIHAERPDHAKLLAALIQRFTLAPPQQGPAAALTVGAAALPTLPTIADAPNLSIIPSGATVQDVIAAVHYLHPIPYTSPACAEGQPQRRAVLPFDLRNTDPATFLALFAHANGLTLTPSPNGPTGQCRLPVWDVRAPELLMRERLLALAHTFPISGKHGAVIVDANGQRRIAQLSAAIFQDDAPVQLQNDSLSHTPDGGSLMIMATGADIAWTHARLAATWVRGSDHAVAVFETPDGGFHVVRPDLMKAYIGDTTTQAWSVTPSSVTRTVTLNAESGALYARYTWPLRFKAP